MNAFFHQLLPLDRSLSRGDRWFFRLFELFVAGGVMYYAWSWAPYIARIQHIVLPLGIAQYVDISFMFDHGLSFINAALMTLGVLLGFARVLPHVAYPVVLGLFHLHYVSRYCLGEISHGSNLVGMAVMALAIGSVAFREEQHRQRFVMGFVFFFTGLGYTLAAFCKLIGTGITWPSGLHLWLWMAESGVDTLAGTGSYAHNWLQTFAASNFFFATFILAFGWVAEFCGVLMWWPRFRPYVALALVAMHFGIAVVMNISFNIYMIELLIIGLPWAMWIDTVLDRPMRETWGMPVLASLPLVQRFTNRFAK